jgi:hypothetical protein
MRAERLRLRAGEVQLFWQEDFELLLDFFHFCLWTDDSDEPILGVASVPEAAKIAIR